MDLLGYFIGAWIGFGVMGGTYVYLICTKDGKREVANLNARLRMLMFCTGVAVFGPVGFFIAWKWDAEEGN
jgi:hypothetical protein